MNDRLPQSPGPGKGRGSALRRILRGAADVEHDAVVRLVNGIRTVSAWFEGLTGWRRLLADFVLLWLICLLAIGEIVGLWYLHH